MPYFTINVFFSGGTHIEQKLSKVVCMSCAREIDSLAKDRANGKKRRDLSV